MPEASIAVTPRVEMIGISQTFGTTKVLDNVDLSIAPSEIRALVGQNGAGKSTLMKILGGIYPEHEGAVRIDGHEATLTSPRDALREGIGLIHQELSLIPSMTVAENIMLGIEPGRAIYAKTSTREAARSVISAVPMLAQLPVDALVSELSTGLQQRVEIAKVLSRDVKVLVMDEPTARLSGPERSDLRDLMVELASGGMAIVYISHFLEEIFQSCHSATVLRNGLVVDSGPIENFSLRSMTRAMLNEELAAEEAAATSRSDRHIVEKPVIRLSAVSSARVTDIDLVVNAGEFVGLAGLVGSGRTRVARTLVGAERVLRGRILVDDKPVSFQSPRAALAQGIVLVPESRKTEGIIGSATAAKNMILMALDRGMAPWGVVAKKRSIAAISDTFSGLQIRPADPMLEAKRFSGGNQQKLLLARVLLAKPRVIVADQPTAGVDVGTKAQIHRLLRTAGADGTAIVVISDDLDELIALCDRIVVMKNGRIIGEYPRSEITRQSLIDQMSGAESAQTS
ncbi:sugar ABC transporter ATP-binding protein [Salinibacterium sp. M195]|uniref:sugar ABC transporter ATP-binding protein n=1 Tax=Salinibacterium sp. M195 TaxID=2583374 RepID=UPI001C625B5E|nr:sugar ABC transporter ATP-binding protein [Salinibacterium sp. M195]QYH36151.1 sugar ABC transporter ATP-binding protein [Salinibacterium sp. M195]